MLRKCQGPHVIVTVTSIATLLITNGPGSCATRKPTASVAILANVLSEIELHYQRGRHGTAGGIFFHPSAVYE